MRVLVTGATGYIGGRLVSRLLQEGHQVRILARDPSRLEGRPWRGQVEVFQGDTLQPPSLRTAMDGVEAAYYLVHSMMGGSGFHERDLRSAKGFAEESHRSGVKRIIYLGGLGDPHSDLSNHLRSRQETGKVLGSTGVPVTELRAGIVVGAGSISFEMIRYLTERLPVMIGPKWLYTRTQPISIRNVLDYLAAVLRIKGDESQIMEIGGPDVLTYEQMLLGYAQVRGLRRFILQVPVLTPRLSSYWVHWITPVPAAMARPLIESLRNEVIVKDDSAQQFFPEIIPVSYEQAVREALDNLDARSLETAWTDALVTSQGDLAPVTLTTQDGMFVERRTLEVRAAPEKVFSTFVSLGGATGWLYANRLWKLRALIDQIFGGVGFRRTRRDPVELRVGDALDFWRVEALEPDRKMLLRAEMKVPGRAWLQFEVQPLASGMSQLVQSAIFAPKGLSGFLYWYILYWFHSRIFSGLIKAVELRAEVDSQFSVVGLANFSRIKQNLRYVDVPESDS